MAQFPATGTRGPARQGGPGQLLDLHLHQLVAPAALPPCLGCQVLRQRAGGNRRAHPRVPVRTRSRQRPPGCTDMGISYPVALDSDYSIWRAFANHYWPALYFADAQGHIRHHHFGEGEYEQSEMVIQQLLTEAGSGAVDREMVSVTAAGIEAPADWGSLRSPENYVGYERTENFVSDGGLLPGQPYIYAVPAHLRRNEWALSGDWTIGDEATRLNSSDGRIAYRFHARDLNVVMGPAVPGTAVPFRVLIDGEPPGANHGTDVDDRGLGQAAQPRLYQLIRQRGPITDRTFEIAFSEPGVQAYAFTFG